MPAQPTFHRQNFRRLCRELADREAAFARLIERDGYPPLWRRPRGFAAFVHIVAGQQVSVASAAAIYRRVEAAAGSLESAAILALGEEGLRACGLTRQKSRYVFLLAQAVCEGRLPLDKLPRLSDETIAELLLPQIGIGRWSVDIYLVMSLNRLDVWPIGDLAMRLSMIHELALDPLTPPTELTQIAEVWRPYRSIATYLLWHAYVTRKRLLIVEE